MTDDTPQNGQTREPNGGGHRGTRHMATVARQVEAMTLRASGMGYAEIATQLGFAGRSGAFAAVQRGLRQTVAESAALLRELELARLDQLQASLWPDAVGEGDDPPDLAKRCKAITVILKIMARRAALMGLDRLPITSDSGAQSLKDVATAMALDMGMNPEEVYAEAKKVLALMDQRDGRRTGRHQA